MIMIMMDNFNLWQNVNGILFYFNVKLINWDMAFYFANSCDGGHITTGLINILDHDELQKQQH